ncbi:hypothetical protein BDV93DRAFT_570770, partial [Ceratobasidium sp. AG-I]
MAPVKKRRVICDCPCRKRVTTETQKRHLQAENDKKRVSLSQLRTQMRRLSTLESIRAHRARSSARNETQLSNHAGLPDDFLPATPPPPESPTAPAEPPELDLTQLWEQVMRARPLDLEGPQSLSEGFPSSFQSATDSDASAEPFEDASLAYNPATYGLSTESHLKARFLLEAIKEAPNRLLPESLGDIKTFDFIINEKLSVRTYNAMQSNFVRKDLPHMPLPTLKRIRTRMLALSALKPVDYHCCKKSCMCYTGYLSALRECPYCGTARFNAAGAPQAVFSYIPLIPQLLALFCNKSTCQKLQYRATYKPETETIEDIFDGDLYRDLCKHFVTIDGVRKPYRFFEDVRELALGLSVDGMCPFKKRKHSCW